MAADDRVNLKLIDVYYGNNAPSQANRADYYPGTAGSKHGDEVWRDFKIPAGNRNIEGSSGPVEMDRIRAVNFNQNLVCKQTHPAPIETGTKSTDTYEMTQTETQDVDGSRETSTGSNWLKGLV